MIVIKCPVINMASILLLAMKKKLEAAVEVDGLMYPCWNTWDVFLDVFFQLAIFFHGLLLRYGEWINDYFFPFDLV